MADVFVLGAGFSKAIHNEMPTMAELAKEVRSRLNRSGHTLPLELMLYEDDIEMWMSYLSRAQPWLSDSDVDFNKSLASRIREIISQILEEHISQVVTSAPPKWLNRLIASWHERQAVIVTLNYDTLIESAVRYGVSVASSLEKKLPDNKQVLLPANIYPPYLSDIASRRGDGLWGFGHINTFRLFKLHGSVNWHYSGRERYFGETIFFRDVQEFEAPNDIEKREATIEILKNLARDKATLIIPPIAEKTTYFNNETIRGIWRDAGTALQEASAVYVLGYSLPKSDFGMKLFLTGNLPSSDTPISLVNLDQGIISRFKDALGREVQTDFVHEDDPIVDFVEEFLRDKTNC